ncbi:HAD family hydrolase [Paenibacillus hemerocallicola]|uniref:HAD family hydrolase n=1 Tax=Paenibacillus hemerocallicola TaxID=1172614 RepID=A0A5C4T330_9BACL|nr:HAD family hydrolase [Paenibacillus hemerocallicola]TNJ62687.1 HAD family hydrolase [Paenibacillus hemerocallicola]
MQTTGLRDIPALELWKRDLYLRRLEPLIDSVGLISLDVFDTLLFRCSARPADVFEAAAAKAIERGIMRRPTTPAEYRTMRIAAERLAREREESGSGEVPLEQIYELLPASIGDRSELSELELEAERESCFVNPNVASLIRYCRSRNIRVALLSDMYLSSAQLVSILTAGGLEAGLLDAVLVSSEEGCGKRSGELFDVLLRRFPDVRADRIVHIGDNETADVLGAAKRGIEAIHYAVIPDTIDSPLHWESIRHGSVLPEIAAIRKLAGTTVLSETGEREPFFYRFGSGMLGPFVQGFCDWVLDKCSAENRSEIHPLMREAHLLGPALESAARMRGLKIGVKPLYVSRQATLLASMRDFTERELEQVSGLGHITLGEVAGMLGIDAADVPENLQRHLHMPAAEARSHAKSELSQETHPIPARQSEQSEQSEQPQPSDQSLYGAFKQFMLREPIASQARATIARQRKLLLEYIRQTCDSPDKLFTVDLGFNGTIQAAIDAAYEGENAKHESIHLLAVGTERSAERMLQGTDIRCWIGIGADNGDMARRFVRSPGLIEELMMGEFGSTVRYERREDGIIEPVLAELAIPGEQFRYKKACQDGVFAFQSYYEHLHQAKPQMARNTDPRQWCGILHRVLDMPTPEEAAALGDLVHQDNFGGVQIIRLCEPIPVEWQSRGGDYLIDLAAFGPKTANVFWPQGLVTRNEPYRLYKAYLRLQDSFGSAVLAFNAIHGLKQAGLSSAILYGNGDFAFKLIHEALLHGIRIGRIIDPASPPKTHDGSPAAPHGGAPCPAALEEAIATASEHVYLIGTLNDIEEYKRTISDAYGRLLPDIAPRVFGPFA